MGSGKKIGVGMGVLAAAAAVVVGLVLGIKNDSSHGTSAAAVTPSVSPSSPAAQAEGTPAPRPGPAQKLAGLDGTLRPADEYQQVLDALAPRCAEDRTRLTAVVDSTLRDLKKHGVDDEDEFSVLQHLERAVPAGNPRTSCASQATAYATQREGS